MAQRRMFSLQIVDTDAFMDMPLSAQSLYFHLGMRADDDGFVNNARRIQRLIGAADDDLKLLALKRFILTFESGIVVIKHWRMLNTIKGDRYKPTLYQDERATLFLKPDGAYTDHPAEGAEPLSLSATTVATIWDQSGTDSEPERNQDGTKMESKVRLGKDRLGLGKGRIEKEKESSGGGDACEAAKDAADDYMGTRGIDTDAYLGVTDEDKAAIAAYTEEIFKRFTNRTPTDVDRAYVFQASRRQDKDPETGELVVTFPRPAVDLLMYAFEQAAGAGKPGDWRYINGVLSKLHQRGISTVEQAEIYDFEKT